MRITQAILDQQRAKVGLRTPAAKTPKQKRRGRMNDWEKAYAVRLDTLKLMGEVVWWAFEPMSLRLADGAKYTPDFMVKMKNGSYEFHEVKGFWRGASRLRIKVAAEIYGEQFRFIAVTRENGEWVEEEF